MILPDAGRHFVWRETPYGPALVCRPLETIAPHVFTTAPWTLGRARLSEEAWAEVATALGFQASQLRRARQVHRAAVLVADGTAARAAARAPAADGAADSAAAGAAVSAPDGAADRLDIGPHALPEADIVVAGSPDVVVAVQVADCVPLLLADVRTGAVAAAHAGWRGLALDVPGTTVAALDARFSSRPSDLVAAIGPAIGACCYEVGADVRAAFAGDGVPESRLAEWFRPEPDALEGNPPLPGLPKDGRPGRWYFDSWRVARDQLIAAGVPSAQIFFAELCTASHPGVFCSYRGEGTAAGRFAAAITRSSRRP